MRILLTFLLAGLSISCSSIDHKNVTSPYLQYSKYLELLSAKNYDDALFMLSSYNQYRFQHKDTSEGFEEFFPFFSSVDSVVVNEVSNFQEYYNEKSCLTVSGFNANSEPTSLNFELVNEGNSWKFNYVHMAYHESKNEFPETAVCPVIP